MHSRGKCLSRHNRLGQEFQEKINLEKNKLQHEKQFAAAFLQKTRRYESLRQIIGNINQRLEINHLCEYLVSAVFDTVAGGRGVCLIYLVDPSSHKLGVYRTRKESQLVIKDKEGDIFDFWVLKHTSPLLIEDIRKDFRFDADKLKAVSGREISSLISVPLISEQKFIGILRLDHQQCSFFNQEDLRFLATIADNAAVALENAELFRKTQELAIQDELTGLFTKGYFTERLREECKRAARQGVSLSLMLFDIDDFKKYNDKLGHTAGDLVLKSISGKISSFFHDKRAVISRFGGEEFCVSLIGISPEKACELAEGLRAAIEGMQVNIRNLESGVTVSVGLSFFPNEAQDEMELIMKADKAMYKAKQQGKNRVVVLRNGKFERLK